MTTYKPSAWIPRFWLLAALAFTAAIYWSGLHGGFIFDDYPNIVDNQGVQPDSAHLADLARAAMSSPASDFKRPLASLSFAANYLVSGLTPFPMKLTNLIIHLANGWLVYLLATSVLAAVRERDGVDAAPTPGKDTAAALLIAFGWLVLPINLTAVLYVVQRMESLANLFVLGGLLGYLGARRHMLRQESEAGWGWIVVVALSLTIPTALGLLAKETAAMLPLYAFVAEWVLFKFQRKGAQKHDSRLVALFALVLFLPLIVGLTVIVPGLLRPQTWAVRDFTMSTRLLTEARVVVDYIEWSLLPTADALSFYHDDFVISSDLFSPMSTIVCMIALAFLLVAAIAFRNSRPLVSLGIGWFFAAQLMTATIVPLELVYEHRNYFASFGLLVALVPWLVQMMVRPRWQSKVIYAGLLVLLLSIWAGTTAYTAYAWGEPLRLATELAVRGPTSPRAQYELGRTYIIYSGYKPESPFAPLAYAPLERAAMLPKSSILPQQALIFFNARMRLPLKESWWTSMYASLASHKPGIQDESSLSALTQCVRDKRCDLPSDHMARAFEIAMDHPAPSARLMAIYGDYAWNVLEDHDLGLSLAIRAAETAGNEPQYWITVGRMHVAVGQLDHAREDLSRLRRLNVAGSLDDDVASLDSLIRGETKDDDK